MKTRERGRAAAMSVAHKTPVESRNEGYIVLYPNPTCAKLPLASAGL